MSPLYGDALRRVIERALSVAMSNDLALKVRPRSITASVIHGDDVVASAEFYADGVNASVWRERVRLNFEGRGGTSDLLMSAAQECIALQHWMHQVRAAFAESAAPANDTNDTNDIEDIF